MPMKGLQPKGIARRNKMLHAAIMLFLENGYEKTTTAQISMAVGMSATSFFAAFESKEALLLELTRVMFSGQFAGAEQLVADDPDPLTMYAIELALQLHITELTEPIREVYVMAYSLSSTSDYIYRSTAEKLQQLFAAYMPDATAKDFYELDIASSSIVRGFTARPCDVYFTIEQKIRRVLECCLILYHIPDDQRARVIDKVCAMPLRPVAEKLIYDVVKRAEAGLLQAMENSAPVHKH